MSDGERELTAMVRPGDILAGRYRLLEVVGRGGMGTVFKAVQTSVERDVAVKVMHPKAGADHRAVSRFQREARAVAALSHPNTIRLIDFGQTEGGALYIVTEYLDGEPLSRFAAKHAPLTPARVVRIATQVCESLAEAHASGIVHRDIKPDNLFVASLYGREDFVKVLDFGIAKMDGAVARGDERLTSAGVCIGSPKYLAPEQALAEPVTHQADIYALGVVMYELLAGQPLFEYDVAQAYMLAHIEEVPRPLKPYLEPAYHPLADVVMSCLEKHPLHRPDGAHGLIAALDQSASESRRASPPLAAKLSRPEMPPVARTIDASSIHTLDLVDTGRSRASELIVAAVEPDEAMSSRTHDHQEGESSGRPVVTDAGAWQPPVVAFAASALLGAAFFWWAGQTAPPLGEMEMGGQSSSVESTQGPPGAGGDKDLNASKPAVGAVDVVALRPASERPVHELRITSSPESARVVGGGVELCQTPCSIAWDGDPVYTHLTVLHPGYQPATFRLDRHEDVELLRLDLKRE